LGHCAAQNERLHRERASETEADALGLGESKPCNYLIIGDGLPCRHRFPPGTGEASD
jgi:hypothetical protein